LPPINAPYARLTIALLFVSSVVVLAPLFATAVPPLHDYPFHLARMDAIAVLTGQTAHPTHYRLGSFLLPNVAMDVATLGLTAFLPTLLAGRVFLGFVLLMLLSGTVVLHRAIQGRFSPWPLLAALFLYNWIFLFGFINYLFGVGVMLWSVAAWLAMRRSGVVLRLLVGTVLAVVTLLCHLVAFGLFAVVLGGLALTDAATQWKRAGIRTLLIPAIPVAIAFGLFVMLSPTAGEVRQPFAYAGWFGWKPLVAYRTLSWPIPWLNIATFGPLAVLVAIAAWRRHLRVAKFMLPPIALLCVTFVVMPNNLFGGQYADARLPIAMLLIVIASVDLVRVPPRALLVGIVLTMGLLVLRGAVIARDWHDQAAVIAEYEAAFARLPPDATLYAASAVPFPKLAYNSPEEFARWRPPLKHIVSLASIGTDVFVPATWADPFQQPIEVLPKDAAAKALQGDNPFLTPTADILAKDVTAIRSSRAAGSPPRDFILLLRPDAMVGAPPPGLETIARGGDFTLFRIE
jgi:hypothetical protein